MASSIPASAAAGDDEDSIIRHRLLTHTASARGEPPLNKVAKAFARLIRAVEEGGEKEGQEDSGSGECAALNNALAAAEALEIACGAIEILGTKAAAAAAAAEADTVSSVAKLEQFRAAAAASRAAIDDRRAELTAARLARSREEQYESLRAELTTLPRRGRTAAARAAAEERKGNAERAAARAREALEERTKQVAALAAMATVVSARCDADEEAFGGGSGGGRVVRRRPATPAAAAANVNPAAVANANTNEAAAHIEVDGVGEEGELEEGEAME